jgi:hypothetical protein
VAPSGGLIALHYPCLDSMHLQRIDDQVETLMHVSGRIVNEKLETSLDIFWNRAADNKQRPGMMHQWPMDTRLRETITRI